VKILLRRDDINPDKPDKNCQTPLRHAAFNGCEGVVKILLKRDNVGPNKPDCIGQTPLGYAASNGYEGVVKILLGRDDVSPNNPDSIGQTPLLPATYRREVAVLLNGGRTPLSCPTRGGHAGVIAMLQSAVRKI